MTHDRDGKGDSSQHIADDVEHPPSKGGKEEGNFVVGLFHFLRYSSGLNNVGSFGAAVVVSCKFNMRKNGRSLIPSIGRILLRYNHSLHRS